MYEQYSMWYIFFIYIFFIKVKIEIIKPCLVGDIFYQNNTKEVHCLDQRQRWKVENCEMWNSSELCWSLGRRNWSYGWNWYRKWHVRCTLTNNTKVGSGSEGVQNVRIHHLLQTGCFPTIISIKCIQSYSILSVCLAFIIENDL